jgi:hypothetical protein
MTDTSDSPSFYRRCGVVALVATAVLLPASALIQPDLPNGGGPMLSAVHDVGWRAPAATTLFMLGQLFNLVGLATIGYLLRDRARRLAAVGVVIAFVGAFAEAVYTGVSFTISAMAADPAGHATYAPLIDQMMSSPVGLIALTGLAGSVVGVLLLSIGIFRSHLGPRWIGPALWVFLVLEYAVSGVSIYAGYLAVLVCLAAYLALARVAAAPGRSTSTAAVESTGGDVRHPAHAES